MKKLLLIQIIFIISTNILYAQDFRLGFGYGGSQFSEKTIPDSYSNGKWSSDFSLSAPRIFAIYSFGGKYAAEVRIEAEINLEALEGASIGLLGRYYPHELIFLQGGILMHKTAGSAHGMVQYIETTMFLPAIGLGLQPAKALSIDAMYVFGGNYIISNSVPPYGKVHDWKLDWMIKIGAGYSFSI